VKIVVPNSAFLENIGGFLRKMETRDQSRFEICFHERWISVHPFVLSLIASAASEKRRNGVEVKGNVPAIQSMNYLTRMKLFDFLGIPPPREITEHESAGRFIPVTQIRDSDELHDFITEMIPLLHAEPAESDPIKYVMSELVRNVLEHSDSPDGAFISAQYLKSSNRIAIGVADSGRGILGHMQQHHPVSSHREAILLALRPGITGTTRRFGGTETNAGAGLFFTRNIAKASQNYFAIYSGDTVYKLQKWKGRKLSLYADATSDPHSIYSDLPSWQGTAIGIDIAMEQTQSFTALLRLIRDVYSVNVRQDKKRGTRNRVSYDGIEGISGGGRLR
jgi:anti-sigma regulatory factor (Ser/Thr protein kinase)